MSFSKRLYEAVAKGDGLIDLAGLEAMLSRSEPEFPAGSQYTSAELKELRVGRTAEGEWYGSIVIVVEHEVDEFAAYSCFRMGENPLDAFVAAVGCLRQPLNKWKEDDFQNKQLKTKYELKVWRGSRK